ncbi:MAG: redoxin domain-containing protein [Anaerolineales bacterium]|nr:redoxin domain-containing protein [Anaerolineales bacterium]
MPLTSQRSWLIFSIGVLILGAAWIGISAAPPGSTTQGGIPAPQAGFQAPDFTLQTPDGESVTLSDLRGQVVLVNLWASWCGPCRIEMPAMQQVYEAYHDQGFTILAVNATYQDNVTDALAFAAELDLTFPIVLDVNGQTSDQYELRSLPSSFFIDRDGQVQEVVVGSMSESLLRVRVEQLLEGGR